MTKEGRSARCQSGYHSQTWYNQPDLKGVTYSPVYTCAGWAGSQKCACTCHQLTDSSKK